MGTVQFCLKVQVVLEIDRMKPNKQGRVGRELTIDFMIYSNTAVFRSYLELGL